MTHGPRASAGGRRVIAAVLVGLVGFGLGARLALAAGPAPAPGPLPATDVYRRPLGNEPATLDPSRIRDWYSLSVAQQMFDGLVALDQTLAVRPALAEFWTASRDGLKWRFSLRKGVKFHHGREVTADDVVYSLTRLIDPATRSGAADLFGHILGAREFQAGRPVAGLVAVDRHTVEVTLTEASVPFVSVLGVGHAKIVPRELVESAGAAFGERPVGTGPFRFVRWERGREIVLAANPDYFEGPPRLGRVVFRIFAGENRDRVYEEFAAGALEDSPVPSQGYRQVIESRAYQHVRRPMFSIRHYGLSTRLGPLQDRRVRRAIVHAIDREAIVKDIFQGRFVEARGVLPPGTLGYNPRLAGYVYDPARAAALLAEAGYPGGRGLPALEIWVGVRNSAILREHERIGKDLAAVGIHAEFHYETDWPSFSRRMAARGFPMFLRDWFADVPDPENFLGKLFHSQSPRNYTGYANREVDALLQRARETGDAERRVELYRKVEEIVLEDAAIVPVWHSTYERLFQPHVRGIEVSGLGDPYIPLRKIWLDPPR